MQHLSLQPREAIRSLALAVVLGATVQGLARAAAQDYPARPVTIVVPFTPGGSTELVVRVVGQKFEQRFGRPFLVQTKPGGGTAIGANAVAKATARSHIR